MIFDMEAIKRKKPKKTIAVSVRITPRLSKWIKDNNYSPTGIFVEACKELGYKEEGYSIKLK